MKVGISDAPKKAPRIAEDTKTNQMRWLVHPNSFNRKDAGPKNTDPMPMPTRPISVMYEFRLTVKCAEKR